MEESHCGARNNDRGEKERQSIAILKGGKLQLTAGKILGALPEGN